MTTYMYKLILDDSETIMMIAALEMMISHCEGKLAEKPEAPYYSWLSSAKAVKSRIHGSAEQTSGNNFGRRPKDTP